MYGPLKSAIINVLQQANLVNAKWVYAFEPTQPGGFPAISVTAFTGDAVFADTQRNRRNYTFRIRCFMERQNAGTSTGLNSQEEAERILTELVDNIIGVFDNRPNLQLDGSVQNLVFVQPIPQEWGYTQAPLPDMRIADIKLNAVVVQ